MELNVLNYEDFFKDSHVGYSVKNYKESRDNIKFDVVYDGTTIPVEIVKGFTGLDVSDEKPSVVDIVDYAKSVVGLLDYPAAKSRLFTALMSTERTENKEVFSNLVSSPFDALASYFRVSVYSCDQWAVSFAVTKELLASWGISEDTLKKDALDNSQGIAPVTFRTLNGIVLGYNEKITRPANAPIVVSTKLNIYGAGVVAYPDFFEKASKCMGGNFLMLPSSVHEWILVPDLLRSVGNDFEEVVKSCKHMVSHINETQVAISDQLSDTVYHYDVDRHEFLTADDYRVKIAHESEGLYYKQALDLITEFDTNEYPDYGVSVSVVIKDHMNIPLAYSTWESDVTGKSYTVESHANLICPSISMFVNGKLRYIRKFKDLQEMIDTALVNLEFNALTTPPDQVAEWLNLEYKGTDITGHVLTVGTDELAA
jgi:hypothetical protein